MKLELQLFESSNQNTIWTEDKTPEHLKKRQNPIVTEIDQRLVENPDRIKIVGLIGKIPYLVNPFEWTAAIIGSFAQAHHA